MRLGWKKFGHINISEEENIKAFKGARHPRNKTILIQIKGIRNQENWEKFTCGI
jgi:hypothetical protein